MFDQGNRTFIGSVVFVDIVGYSKKTVSEQITIKERFTTLLSDSLVDIPAEQRLILDTGDGAALSFLGDPEDALFVSMSMRDIVSRTGALSTPHEPGSETSAADGGVSTEPLPLRIGINLGPVKLIRDINGQPNIVGDGINVAQRIMSFSQPGQIVVSRSFFDVVSVISDEYAKLFRYEGSRTDKHVREHEIYVVGDSDAAFKMAKAGTVDRAAGVSTGSFGVRPQAAESESLPFLQDRKKLTIAGGALAAVVLALLLILILKSPPNKTIDASTTKPGTASQADVAKSESAKIETSAGTTATPAPAVTQTDAGKSTEPTSPMASPATIAATATGQDQKDAAAKDAAAKVDAAKVDANKAIVLGSLNFQINPWGDVYVNGKSIGASPPMKQHKLAPGKYKVEVKNTSFTSYVVNVEIKAKEDVNIKYTFR